MIFLYLLSLSQLSFSGSCLFNTTITDFQTNHFPTTQGTGLVSLSRSLGKDEVVAEEGELSEARRGSHADVEENKEDFF